MKFSKNKYGIFLFAAILIFASCVQFKKVSLYDGVEPETKLQKPKDLDVVIETEIYDEDATDVWGLEKDVCQDVSITTDVAYSGEESIKLTWNRDAKGCVWSGIGIGWDAWAGKDLTPIMDYAAIQMYVRTIEGKSFGLPFVLTLIDYNKGMGFSYTANKYFERTAIDENWQKVVVPLSSFEIEKENLDPSNIQQLQIELQQNGNFYLDDIKLVFYEEQPQKPWMAEEQLPDPTQAPIQIMDDAFINNNGWGLVEDICKKIEWTDQESSQGEQSLYLNWGSGNDCSLTAIGVSWNKWNPVDITPIRETAAFQFDLKMANGNANALPINFGFEDYERAKTFVKLQSEFVEGGQYSTSWKKVTIPISAIPEGIDFSRVKQIYINLEGKGEVYIDNLKLIRIDS